MKVYIVNDRDGVIHGFFENREDLVSSLENHELYKEGDLHISSIEYDPTKVSIDYGIDAVFFDDIEGNPIEFTSLKEARLNYGIDIRTDLVLKYIK